MKTLMVDEKTCQECADFLSLVEEALKPERRYSLDQVTATIHQTCVALANECPDDRAGFIRMTRDCLIDAFLARDQQDWPVIDPTLLDKKPTSPTPAEEAAERLGYAPFAYEERS